MRVVWTTFHHHHILQYHLNRPPLTQILGILLSQIDSSGGVSKRQDTSDQIDLLLVKGHPLNTYAKLTEKLTFLTP